MGFISVKSICVYRLKVYIKFIHQSNACIGVRESETSIPLTLALAKRLHTVSLAQKCDLMP